MKISNRIKAAYHNKVTLAGYLSLATLIGTSMYSLFAPEESGAALKATELVSAWGSIILLSLTTGGKDTYTSYTDISAKIEEDEQIAIKWYNAKEHNYCDKVAAKWAFGEANLREYLIHRPSYTSRSLKEHFVEGFMRA